VFALDAFSAASSLNLEAIFPTRGGQPLSKQAIVPGNSSHDVPRLQHILQQRVRITTSRPVSRSPFPLQQQRNSSSAQVSPPFGTDQVYYQKYNDRECVVEMLVSKLMKTALYACNSA
jgi:hypothetical protein